MYCGSLQLKDGEVQEQEVVTSIESNQSHVEYGMSDAQPFVYYLSYHGNRHAANVAHEK